MQVFQLCSFAFCTCVLDTCELGTCELDNCVLLVYLIPVNLVLAGHPDPLVLHCQLRCGCVLPLWHHHYDHHPHFETRHRKVQHGRWWHWGKHRRDRWSISWSAWKSLNHLWVELSLWEKSMNHLVKKILNHWRMEVGSRRCFPASFQQSAFRGGYWVWDPGGF